MSSLGTTCGNPKKHSLSPNGSVHTWLTSDRSTADNCTPQLIPSKALLIPQNIVLNKYKSTGLRTLQEIFMAPTALSPRPLHVILTEIPIP
jgi:hypothetical protein